MARRALETASKTVCFVCLFFGPSTALGQTPSLNFYGVGGGIDMPSATPIREGELSATITSTQNIRRVTTTFQFTPRISGTFRYAYLDGFFSDDRALYDRSFDLRFQLATETRTRPSIVIGLQDFVGTGILSSEYIVATKTVRPRLKVSGGIGWGRLGTYNSFDNPIGIVADRFKNRSQNTRGIENTGDLDFGQWFRGDAALFGGIEWQSVDQKWTLKAEYSSDDYTDETARGIVTKKSPLNFGVEYQLGQRNTVGLYYLYGTQVALKFSTSLNVMDPLQATLEDAPIPIAQRGQIYSSSARLFGRVIDAQNANQGYDGILPPFDVETSVTGVRIARVNSPCSQPVAREIDAEAGSIDLVIFDPRSADPECTVILRPAGATYVDAISQRPDFTNATETAPATREAAAQRLSVLLKNEGIRLISLSWNGSAAEVRIENRRYDAEAQAIGRAARAMSQVLPADVEQFSITPVSEGLALSTTTIQRSDLEALEFDPDGAWRSFVRAQITNAEVNANTDTSSLLRFPRFSGSLGPYSEANLFDPDNPIRIDVGLLAVGRVDIARGFSVTGAVSKRAFGNIPTSSRGSNSVLQRVRTDIDKYQKQGDPSLERLTADYFFKLSPTTFGRVSAGYFETMYGGVSTELLWKPVASNFALGAELNWVKQRDFDQRLGFQDYETVTGHASLYWDVGNGFHTQVDVGRYLAKDFGATLRVEREFNNGWKAGAYMTLTDVSFEDFGEGSFDKGISLSVPLSWLSGVPQRNAYTLEIQPVLRDGGAKLKVPGRLYPSVRDYDAKSLKRSWGKYYR